MKIKFEEHGKGDPVVLLHAFPLSRKMWQPQVEAFDLNRFRLILPDHRGFGETELPADVSAMDEMAADAAELLDDLGIKKAVIGGLSMGGYAAFALLRIRPDLFKGVVFCDTSCAADTDAKRENRFKLIEKMSDGGMQVLIDEMLPDLIGEFTKRTNGGLISELEPMFAATDANAAAAALRGMAARKDHTYLLPAIDVPTLFIVGEEDTVTPPEISENMHRNVERSSLVVIKNAGHLSNMEQPEAFNSALIDFCEKL